MFTRADKILISLLILLFVFGFIFIRHYTKKANIVLVEVNGEEVMRTKLSKDRRFSVDGLIGKTEIEISNNRVRVVDSPCNKKLCVRSGWIWRPYETIVCLPNRVTISLISQSRSDIDSVTR